MRAGERLKAAVAALGLTLKAAAQKSGVPYRTLQDYTRLQREPNAETLGQICTHLRISGEWLLTGTGDMLRPAADDGPLEVRDDPAAPAPDAGAPGHLSYRLAALAAALERLDPAHADVILAAALARATDAQRIAELEQQVAALAHPRHKKRA